MKPFGYGTLFTFAKKIMESPFGGFLVCKKISPLTCTGFLLLP